MNKSEFLTQDRTLSFVCTQRVNSSLSIDWTGWVQICAAKGQGKKRAAQQAGNQAQVYALSLTQHDVTVCVSQNSLHCDSVLNSWHPGGL